MFGPGSTKWTRVGAVVVGVERLLELIGEAEDPRPFLKDRCAFPAPSFFIPHSDEGGIPEMSRGSRGKNDRPPL